MLLFETRALTDSARWAAQGAPGMGVFLPLPSQHGVTDAHSYAWLFMWVLGVVLNLSPCICTGSTLPLSYLLG